MKAPAAYTDPLRSPGYLVHDVARLWGRRFDQRARAFGLSRAQCKALAFLARNEGINQIGLAELLEVEPMSLVRLLDRMEEAGWIERHPDPSDRRARRLYLGDKAKPILETTFRLADEIRAEALAALSKSDQEKLIQMLRVVHASLSKPEPVAADAATAAAN
jgi:DNA-binding MarR family transcriptional regulator